MKRGEPVKDAKEAEKILKQRQARKLAEATVSQLKDRLAKAEKNDLKPARVEAMKKEIAKREQEAAKIVVDESKPSAAVQFDAKAVIRQAYLRSLSRFPTDSETERAVKYFEETGDPARGTKDSA